MVHYYSAINSLALTGYNVNPIRVEVMLKPGIPGFRITGLGATAAREHGERIRAALNCSQIRIPVYSIVVNIYPADLKKSGASLDLPIAAAILKALNIAEPGSILDSLTTDDTIYLGELSLSGRLLELNIFYPFIQKALESEVCNIVLPLENLSGNRLSSSLNLYGITSLTDLIDASVKPATSRSSPTGQKMARLKYLRPRLELDRLELKPGVVKAVLAAAAGRHSLLMIGPPGCGKSSLAREIHALLPEPEESEALEIIAVKNLIEQKFEARLATIERPFAAPHHTSTIRTLLGGGVPPAPGEITRAHRGILFLDEMAEFSRTALQALREPLEQHRIALNRGNTGSFLPANFLLLMATNPCPCGNYKSLSAPCHCSEQQRRSYLSKILGPLRDRIEIEVRLESRANDAGAESSGGFSAAERHSGTELIARVDRAVARQRERYRNSAYRYNGEVAFQDADRFLRFESVEVEEEWLRLCANLSFRSRSGIRRLARTIADLDDAAVIRITHLYDAVSYQCLDEYL